MTQLTYIGEPEYVLGVDLGQTQDPTAIAIIECRRRVDPSAGFEFDDEGHRVPITQPVYAVRDLVRPPLGTPYPQIVSGIRKMKARKPLVDATLVVDQTGVGRPVVDMMRAADLYPKAVTITGGDTVHETPDGYRVPKREIVVRLQVLFQERRLTIARSLALAETFTRELQNFKVKIDPRTAHDSYAAEREGDHDDIVLAVALAVWWAERPKSPFQILRQPVPGWSII